VAKSYIPVTWRLSPELQAAVRAAAEAAGQSVQAFATATLSSAGRGAPAAEDRPAPPWGDIAGGAAGEPGNTAEGHDQVLAEAYACSAGIGRRP